jgi:hypothetical protein
MIRTVTDALENANSVNLGSWCNMRRVVRSGVGRYSRENLCHGRITTGGKWGVVVFEEARVAQLQGSLGGDEHQSRDRLWLEYESKPRDRGWGPGRLKARL